MNSAKVKENPKSANNAANRKKKSNSLQSHKQQKTAPQSGAVLFLFSLPANKHQSSSVTSTPPSKIAGFQKVSGLRSFLTSPTIPKTTLSSMLWPPTKLLHHKADNKLHQTLSHQQPYTGAFPDGGHLPTIQAGS
jgi:hypothetical protein